MCSPHDGSHSVARAAARLHASALSCCIAPSVNPLQRRPSALIALPPPPLSRNSPGACQWLDRTQQWYCQELQWQEPLWIAVAATGARLTEQKR